MENTKYTVQIFWAVGDDQDSSVFKVVTDVHMDNKFLTFYYGDTRNVVNLATTQLVKIKEIK